MWSTGPRSAKGEVDVAFQIRREESIRRGVKRMAHKELEDARATLEHRRNSSGRHRGKSTEDIHDVRTALKRTRALTRLVEPATGKAARDADDLLRDAGRSLSAIRDGEVLLATFDRLRRSVGAHDGRELAQARHVLEDRLQERTRSLAATKLRALVSKLGRAREDVSSWVPRGDRWEALAPGLVKGYRRCQRRMQVAYAEGTPAAFHAWRRAVKNHRYQIQALEPVWPDELGAWRSGLTKIGDLLGEAHDLSVLADVLREERVCSAEDEGCRRLLAEMERRQQELREAARPIGARLFAEKPSAWARRLGAYYRAFRREEPGIAAESLTAGDGA
jgi:CHAD domain-containing protein